MAAIYGGLCAGATPHISSIAASTSGVTRCTPLYAPPWTALKAMAETSDRPQAAVLRMGQLRQAVMHRLDVIARADRLSNFFADLAAHLHGAAAFGRADPLDAAARSCRWPSMSNRRYLKLVEPRLATRIFMWMIDERLQDHKDFSDSKDGPFPSLLSDVRS